MEVKMIEPRSKSVKLALTSKGYKATVKGSTPDEALEAALMADRMMRALRDRQATPAEPDRKTFPVLVKAEAGGYLLTHGGGDATPFDPSQSLDEDYAVKIDLEFNSKGTGWDVSVKAPTVEAGVAMIEYTEARLAAMFTPAPAAAAG